MFEAEKYVTVSLAVPAIQGLRFGLREDVEELQADPPHGTHAHQLEAMSLGLTCAKALTDDFDRPWEDGTSFLEYRAGPHLQPRGFKRWQLVVTALDWPVKNHRFGLSDGEKDDPWKLVVTETVAMVLADRRVPPTAPRSAPPASVVPRDGVTANSSRNSKKKSA